MKLCALFIVWGDSEIFQACLKHTVNNLFDGNGDNVLVIYSTISNFGEKEDPIQCYHGAGSFNWEPDLKRSPVENETAKRNFALSLAREYGFTHFIVFDEDEFYDPVEFKAERAKMDAYPEILGLVCRTKVYFRLPTLTIGYDTTLVPFIHKIVPKLKFEMNRNYPFAWERGKDIRIDPTRQMNLITGVEMCDATMFHMSWIRSNVRKKIRNSTARNNIERSTIVQDYLNAKSGYFCQFYGKTISECPNVFGIPDIVDHELR